jgi:hypothetical protein
VHFRRTEHDAPPRLRALRVALQKPCALDSGQVKKEYLGLRHFQCIAHAGACGKTRNVSHNGRPNENLPKQESRMRVLFSMHRPPRTSNRGGIAVQLETAECDPAIARHVMPVGLWL